MIVYSTHTHATTHPRVDKFTLCIIIIKDMITTKHKYNQICYKSILYVLLQYVESYMKPTMLKIRYESSVSSLSYD